MIRIHGLPEDVDGHVLFLDVRDQHFGALHPERVRDGPGDVV